MKNLIGIFLIAVVFYGGYLSLRHKENSIKIDNSSTSTPINISCSYNDCLGEKATNKDIFLGNLIEITDPRSGVSFKYPSLKTNYIKLVGAPEFASTFYTCVTGADPKTQRVTKEIEVDGGKVCQSILEDGAAGSIYKDYIFTFIQKSIAYEAKFVLRYPQCMNYDDPKQTECKNEELNFDVLNFISNTKPL